MYSKFCKYVILGNIVITPTVKRVMVGYLFLIAAAINLQQICHFSQLYLILHFNLASFI